MVIQVVRVGPVERNVHDGDYAAVDMTRLAEQIRGIEVETRPHGQYQVPSGRERLRQRAGCGSAPESKARRTRGASKIHRDVGDRYRCGR